MKVIFAIIMTAIGIFLIGSHSLKLAFGVGFIVTAIDIIKKNK